MTSRTLGLLALACMASLAWADDDSAGVYSALVDVGDDPTQLSLSVDAKGYATGTVTHRRQRHIVRGDVSALTLSTHGQQTPLRLIRPHGGEANGFISIGGRTAAFAAGRRSSAQIFSGRYTLITPAISIQRTPPAEGETPDPTTGPSIRPKYLGGHGYGVMTITPAGRYRVTMRLADGQHFSVGGDFNAPLSLSFVAAPSASGSFSGKLKFIEIEDSSDADGAFRWVRDGVDGGPPLLRYTFDVRERLMASRYKPDQTPLKGDSEPRGRMAIKGGILNRNTAAAVYFDDTELSAPDFQFHSRLNETSGTFNSALLFPVYSVPARTGGVVFQKQNRIYGSSETRYGTSGVNIERKVEHLKD